jgi:thiol-disulfide isomerase/thioredoxin
VWIFKRKRLVKLVHLGGQVLFIPYFYLYKAVKNRKPILKYKILSYMLILRALSAAAQPVLFENKLKEAFEKAALENKLVFIEYYNSTCHFCLQLEPLFSNLNLGKFYNTHFVNYKLNTKDMKREDSLFISGTGLKLTTVPVFLFFDAKGIFLHHSDTKPEVDYLVAIGNKAIDPEERDAGLEKKYKKGDRSIKVLYANSIKAQLYDQDSLQTILTDELFDAFPKEDLGNKKSYTITKNCVNSIDNGFFQYWIQHLDKMNELEAEPYKGQGKKRLGEIVRISILSKESETWGLKKIALAKGYILQTDLSKIPDAFFWERETRLLVAQKKYVDALAIGKRMLETEKTGVKASVGIIHHFLDILNTHNELNAVKQWLDDISGKGEDIKDKADLMYLNAFFLIKNKEKEKARNSIAAAMAFYKKNKLDTKSLTDLANKN